MGYGPATLKTRALPVALLFTNERDQQARSRCPDSQDGCGPVRDTER
jgi:hypothetical protein